MERLKNDECEEHLSSRQTHKKGENDGNEEGRRRRIGGEKREILFVLVEIE